MSAGGGFTRTGIATIVDMESREVEVDVNEAYINRVKTNQRVEATLDAYPDAPLAAHVINIVPTADRTKATVRVRIGFDKLEPQILPDMGIKVRFLDEKPVQAVATTRARAFACPRRRCSAVGGESYVWVVSDGARRAPRDHRRRRERRPGRSAGRRDRPAKSWWRRSSRASKTAARSSSKKAIVSQGGFEHGGS